MRKFDCSQCNRPHCLRLEFGLKPTECSFFIEQNEKRKVIEKELYYPHCCKGCKFQDMKTSAGNIHCVPLYQGIADTKCMLVKKWLETRDK